MARLWALDESGRPSFNVLQNYGSAVAPVFYYVFDALVVKGKDLRGETLAVRRAALMKLLGKLTEPVRESSVLDASLADSLASVKAQGLEGVVAKRLDSHYEPGQRSGAWQKMRINQGQEFVIGGYTVTTQRCQGLSLLFLEWPVVAPIGGKHRWADFENGLQEIGRQERS